MNKRGSTSRADARPGRGWSWARAHECRPDRRGGRTMRIRFSLFTVLAAALLAAPAARADEALRYYVSLGDSLAQGYQPIGGSPFGGGHHQGSAQQLLKRPPGPAAHPRPV